MAEFDKNNVLFRLAVISDIHISYGYHKEEDIVYNLNFYANKVADLYHVSGGKLDGVIAPNAMRASITAGALLVKEAGGMVLDMDQKDTRTEDMQMVLNSGNLMAVNFNLSQKIAKILK
jgi:fructose-1,6-bisphosphatase/inositol monophosphatase family enzyme